MNIPSHHQSALFNALDARADVDLEVCYFKSTSATRSAEGWNHEHVFKPFEVHCEDAGSPEEIVRKIPDWEERIHLISSNFSDELVAFFCENKVRWCHWSEMPGVRLAELLDFRMQLFRILNPFMLILKRKEGARMKRNALGVFAQGVMARNSFKGMGVPVQMIENLFYALSALPPTERCTQVEQFARGRKVFLSVAALCKRKGIDVLLKAMARLKTDDWCLVLCGLDKENGRYQDLVERLNIQDNVLFLGAHPSERIAEVYAASDVFVLPSRFDGWGAVLNEAASLGLPLIGTDLCGGAWHAIQKGGNGFRVKAGSVKSLANAMDSYVKNPTLLKAHGEVSTEIFLEELAPERNAQRLVNALVKWSGHES
ncbi:MAG: glycosyltransferase family 4 protein [Pontiella sp.]